MRWRLAIAARTAVGLAMLTRPHVIARLLGASRGGTHPVLRVLGMRHLVQAGVLALRQDATMSRASSILDGSHVLSCLLLAAADPAHRRPALRDAGLESALLLATCAGPADA